MWDRGRLDLQTVQKTGTTTRVPPYPTMPPYPVRSVKSWSQEINWCLNISTLGNQNLLCSTYRHEMIHGKLNSIRGLLCSTRNIWSIDYRQSCGIVGNQANKQSRKLEQQQRVPPCKTTLPCPIKSGETGQEPVKLTANRLCSSLDSLGQLSPIMDLPDFSTYALLASATYGLLQALWSLFSLASKMMKPTQSATSQAQAEQVTSHNARVPTQRKSVINKITVTRTRIAHYENIGCGALASANPDECTMYTICQNCQKQVKKFVWEHPIRSGKKMPERITNNQQVVVVLHD